MYMVSYMIEKKEGLQYWLNVDGVVYDSKKGQAVILAELYDSEKGGAVC